MAKAEYMKIVMIAKEQVKDNVEFNETEAYQELAKKYKRQEWMIMGEALVFIISLIIGVWLINRGYNKEIESANQQRNFLLSITHELKSPLSSIRLILETFQKRMLQPAQIQQLSKSGLQETDRLNTLVNDLLLAAKIETTYHPASEPIPLTDTLHDLIARLRIKFPEAEFTVHCDPQDIFIQGDRLGITSTLINLLENAVKYSPKPAKISASIKIVQDNTVIEIADQGLGIPDSEKKKVFDKFYRVGSEDTRQTKGTGLGLFIVKEIVKAHQGSIMIMDNKPKGSKFKIVLPESSRFEEELMEI